MCIRDSRNTKDPSFEIYSPPYLHQGQRPTIDRAPALLEWGQDFDVRVGGNDSIESFSLIRTPSVSHTVDADQRGITLPVEDRRGANVTVDFSSVDGTVAPPGEYYLFALSEEGVPSVAAIVTVADDTVADAFAPGQLDQMRAAQAYTDNDLDTATTAEAGDAQPYVEGNVLEAMLDRQYPAPGFEDVLIEVFDGAAPEELRSAFADITPGGYHAFVDALTPLGLAEDFEEALGQDPMIREAVNSGWDEVADPGTEAFQEGVQTLGGALSDAATAGAPGSFDNPGLDYGQLSEVPLPDEPLVDMGGDEDGPPTASDERDDERDVSLTDHQVRAAPEPDDAGAAGFVRRAWTSLLGLFG